MRVLVTGGAGFVGSHILDRLIAQGDEVTIYDNFSTGDLRFLGDSKNKVTIVKADILDRNKLNSTMKDVDLVFHMAAHADVKNNLKEPNKLLENNTIGTSNVLEAMRVNDVKRIVFPSTGSIYGEPTIHPTPEDYPFPVQTSLYGASKLAGEGLLQAYSEGYGFNSYIFRFVSLMGERYSHGCVFDFYKQLKKNPTNLNILGDGNQKKSYLYVTDCVNAMFMVLKKSKQKLNIYNLGHDDYIQVTPIAEIMCTELGLRNVKFNYSGGIRGWIGDSPFIHLDNQKVKGLGWKPTLSIPDCIRRTVHWIKSNEWVLSKR